MLEWLWRLTKHYREMTEVAALDGRALSDMGVSRDQALTLAAMPRAVIDRVQTMGHVFGHNAADLTRDRAEWVQLVETCAQCRNVPQCRGFLRQDGHPSPNGAGFCPNRELFAGKAAVLRRQTA